MSPRRYHGARRKAATEQTRRRIVAATVDLHAEQGVIATSYANIAARADVAIPTVYNHFPTRADLLAACTREAATVAPALGEAIYAGAADVAARLRALVDALFAYYAFYSPWMRWARWEAQVVPELAAWLDEGTRVRRGLIVSALEPAFGGAPPAALLALCEILLDFPAWHRVAGDTDLERDGATTVLSDALLALVEMHHPTTPGADQRRASTKRYDP